MDSNDDVIITGYASERENWPFYWDFLTIKYSAISPRGVYLSFETLGDQLVLSWTNAAFSLQSAPDIGGPFVNITGATSPYTNSVVGGRQFFRLKRN